MRGFHISGGAWRSASNFSMSLGEGSSEALALGRGSARGMAGMVRAHQQICCGRCGRRNEPGERETEGRGRRSTNNFVEEWRRQLRLAGRGRGLRGSKMMNGDGLWVCGALDIFVSRLSLLPLLSS